MPLLHKGMTPRPAIVELLLADFESKLVLINAPAGYGKTTLLTEWAASEQESRPFAWVSLEPTDGDPARFLSYLIGAIGRVEPGFGETLRAALSGSVDFEGDVMPRLINELASLPRRIVVVLDDYHAINSKESNELVDFLLNHLPCTIQLVISTRSDPLLSIARLRGRQELLEIRASQLRFNEAEAGALLHAALGFELDRKDVKILIEQTEGWPAGLYLAALSLKDHHDPSRAITEFAGNTRHVVDYLSEEVFEFQTPEVRRFLTRTSVLGCFTASMCDTVVERDDSAEILNVVEHSNLFLVPLDERREWYRYHHLFRELLRIELQRREPESIPSLHRRAAAWYLREGAIEDALQHTLSSGDFSEAGELIARHWLTYLNTGQTATLRTWIAKIPEDNVVDYPPLALVTAWLSGLNGDFAELKRWTTIVENGNYVGPLPDGTTSLESAVAMIRASFAFGDVRRTCEAARRVVELEVDPGSPWHAPARIVFGYSLFWTGAGDESRRMLEEGIRLTQALSPPLPAGTLFAMGYLALIEYEEGNTRRAEQLAHRTIDFAEAHGLSESAQSSAACVVLGMILAERGEVLEAEERMERALALRRSMGRHQAGYLYALLAYAPIRQALGDHIGARTLVDEARALMDEYEDPGRLLLSSLDRAKDKLGLLPRRRGELGQDSNDGELDLMPLLTDRETAVLKLLVTDLTQRQIGGELYLSFNTVKSHARAIYRKLGVSSRKEAVDQARLYGLIA